MRQVSNSNSSLFYRLETDNNMAVCPPRLGPLDAASILIKELQNIESTIIGILLDKGFTEN